MPTRRSNHRSFRLPERVDRLLERACEEQDRSFSNQVSHYVRRGLREDGLLPRHGETGDEGGTE